MKQFYFQRGLIFLLALALCATFFSFNHVVKKQQEVIAEYESLTQRQQEDLTACSDQWQKAYKELDEKYYYLRQELKNIGTCVLPVYDYDLGEIVLLAKCAQCEAGEGNDLSQKYITQVILNRVLSGDFPNTIYEVIYQKDPVVQFSVAYNGMMDTCVVSDRTLVNVFEVLLQGTALPRYVEYFYSDSLLGQDLWITRLATYTTAEGTVFSYVHK